MDYRVAAGVRLDGFLRGQIEKIAAFFRKSTGSCLLVTDGIRSTTEQARIIYRLVADGNDLSIYGRCDLAVELLAAYQTAGDSKAEKLEAIRLALERQAGRGGYISRHLQGLAVDIRCRDMSAVERELFRSIAERLADKVIEESTPPHFHLEFERVSD